MPLSEEEIRLLEQMERALVEEDPKFASTLRGTSMRRSARRRTILAGLGFVIGISVLMAGAITTLWYLGVAGFLIMLGSATLALGAMKGQAPGSADPTRVEHESGLGVIEGGRAASVGKAGSKPGKLGKIRGGKSQGRQSRRSRDTSGSFMERMEERWRRRKDEGGGF